MTPPYSQVEDQLKSKLDEARKRNNNKLEKFEIFFSFLTVSQLGKKLKII